MSKRPARRSQIVERAPFHRGAYVTQAVQAQRATDWLRDHGIDLPLLGSPETGSRRGSNRSEITPAFTYRAVFGDVDPDGPTITLADGQTMLVEEYESLIAEPDIDSVSQHATTAHRDRRLMSAASMTRVRYVPPCVTRSEGSWETIDRWTTTTTTGRYRTLKSGAMVWTQCPTACPATCKVDHRHVRHTHREHGTTYVTGTRPYGADGLARGTVTVKRTTETLTLTDGRLVYSKGPAEVVAQVSKRQGRRTGRLAIGTWTDAAYAVDPTADAVGAVVTVVPCEQSAVRTTTLAPVSTATAPYSTPVGHWWSTLVNVLQQADVWQGLAAPSLPDTDDGLYAVGTGKASDARWTRHEGQTHDTYLVTRERVETPSPWVDHGAVLPLTADETTDTRTVTVRSWVKATREYVTFPAAWSRPPMVPTPVKADKAGAQRAPILALGRVGLMKRIASDPASTALAGRILLAAEHAWTTNGQPVTAEHGLTLTVIPPTDGRPPMLTIAHRDGSETVGTYRARARVVREAVALLLA